METKIESRVGIVNTNEDRVYAFISNFNNFKKFIPGDKVENFFSSEDQCKFNVAGIGEIVLRIVEKEPYKMIKITGEGMSNHQLFLWIQLKQVAEKDTRVKLTVKTDLNPMLRMMATKPLQNFLDKLIDAIEKIQFE
jgi:carbon monoxide dehydrogenase subunit G